MWNDVIYLFSIGCRYPSTGFGNTVTNIEISTPINDLCMIRDRRGDTGLMMVASEETRIQSFYLPALGPAPRWCSFLDTITEELEEGDGRYASLSLSLTLCV
jgi:hypothetical protein